MGLRAPELLSSIRHYLEVIASLGVEFRGLNTVNCKNRPILTCHPGAAASPEKLKVRVYIMTGALWFYNLLNHHDPIPFLLTSTTMVYYFTSNTVSPAAFIYVGKDKVESKNRVIHTPLSLMEATHWPATGGTDEELIKYGLEEDVWY